MKETIFQTLGLKHSPARKWVVKPNQLTGELTLSKQRKSVVKVLITLYWA